MLYTSSIFISIERVSCSAGSRNRSSAVEKGGRRSLLDVCRRFASASSYFDVEFRLASTEEAKNVAIGYAVGVQDEVSQSWVSPDEENHETWTHLASV